jgi:biotin carboxyl carrier protein
MNNPGKVIQITARPAEAANLAVEADGIVEARTVQLGDSVTSFDFAGFYPILGSTIAGSPGQLGFTSQGIRNYGPIAASALLTLRAESLKAALDKAILARENAFYTKYGSAAAIAAKTVSSYSNLSAGSKPQLLSWLSQLSTQRDDLLQTAYLRDGRTGVVESTTSQLTGHTTSSGESTATNTVTESGTSFATGTNQDKSTGISASGEGLPGATSLDEEGIRPFSDEVNHLPGVTMSEVDMTLTSRSAGSSTLKSSGELSTDVTENSDETQTIINTGYDYHVPSIEAKAQYLRAQISLIDEQYDQFIDEQKVLSLNEIFANELKMIDLDVKQLQVAYLNTILLSPINGVVTGVFADVGDSVRAGEVLVRVENNTKVFLEATLVYRGSVSVGDSVTVQTDLFSKPVGPPPHLVNSVTISGTVVAARGGSSDDRWELVLSCDNQDSNGQEILPLHYSFDYDDTSITIS